MLIFLYIKIKYDLKSYDKEYLYLIKIFEEVLECVDFNKVGFRFFFFVSDLI